MRVFFRRKRKALLIAKHPLFSAMLQNAQKRIHTAYSLQLFVKDFVEGYANFLRHGSPGQKVEVCGIGDHTVQIEYNSLKRHGAPPW